MKNNLTIYRVAVHNLAVWRPPNETEISSMITFSCKDEPTLFPLANLRKANWDLLVCILEP